MDIHRSLIKDFIMPKVKSVVVIDYYEGILGVLRSREEFPYNDFLANPRIRTQTEITWATDAFSERPQLLVDLDGVMKERYSYALAERIRAIEALISVLKEEEGGAPLGELLSKAISYIDEQSVYCGNGDVIVVNWGLIPRSPVVGLGCIYRSGKFAPKWDQLYPDPKELDSGTPGESRTVPFITPQPQIPVDATELHQPQSSQEPLESEPMDALPTDVPLGDDPQNGIAEVPEETELMPTVPGGALPMTEASKNDERQDSEKNKSTQPSSDEYTWATLLGSIGDALMFLLRKLWWIIVLIGAIIAILFFCKGCQGPISQINPFYNPLPETPMVLPIEDGAVGISEDGGTQIATDRLNILLEKKDENTMLEWAKAFKKAYPDKDYEIFYYNTELYNLQIRIPVNKRVQVKKEIKDRLSGFSFDVFDETVYNSDAVSFNDPALQDAFDAWYLKEIDAFGAWEISQGDSDIVVAIVDNGFDVTHPELVGKIVHPYNVLTRNANLRPIFTKDGENAHGTHVAATAVGNGNNGSGLLGIAPLCKLLPVQVGNDNAEGLMSGQAVRDGVLYAISQGADVINLSLGTRPPNNVKSMSESEQLNFISSSMKEEEYLWAKIYEKAKQHNCIIVFAAGNDNVISGVDPQKRSSEAILVSALDTDLTKADFSNFGVYPHLNRTYSTVSAPGVSIYSAAPHNDYVYKNGTSMAAPIVTGTVALLKGINRNMEVNQAISILQQSGWDVGENIGPMINVHRALMLARGDKLPTECDEIREQVNRLQAQIDSLKRICPDADMPGDTLKFEDAVKDKHGLDGLWKSTTSLVSTSDNSPIELYMQFSKLEGTLTIVNNGNEYKAPLKASVRRGKVSISQKGPATNGMDTFTSYTYECTSDRKGNLMCAASSEKNSFTFNLVRVK